MILLEALWMTYNTLYVYDEQSGKIQYTIDNAGPDHIKNLQKDNLSVYLGPAGSRLVGTYVKKDDETGEPIGICPVEHMSFIQINKHVAVANGTDEIVISGLKKGMRVNINKEHSYVVDDESGTTLELSCNNFSYAPQHNHMRVYFKAYGYHDSVISVQFVEEE